jgi:hypothetical protein
MLKSDSRYSLFEEQHRKFFKILDFRNCLSQSFLNVVILSLVVNAARVIVLLFDSFRLFSFFSFTGENF